MSHYAYNCDQLVDLAEGSVGVKLKRRYNLSAPKGINGRIGDNTLIDKLFDWQSSTRLRDGLEWIYEQMAPRTTVAQVVE